MIELAPFCAVTHTTHHHHVRHHSNAQQARQTFVLLRSCISFSGGVASPACLSLCVAIVQHVETLYCVEFQSIITCSVRPLALLDDWWEKATGTASARLTCGRKLGLPVNASVHI